MFVSLLLVAAAAASPPRPALGPIKAFADWAVACDNVHACEMTSLIAEGDDSDQSEAGQFSITRAAGPAEGVAFEAYPGNELRAASVRIDGKIIVDSRPAKEVLRLDGEAAARVVAAMANGKRLTLHDAAGKEVGHASLAGSSAALRFIDAEQGRAGTVTATIAKGARPAGAVPAASPLPRIRSIVPSGVPAPVTPALRKAMLAASGCDAEDANTKDPLEAHALGGGKTLVLLPCGAGAYNFSSVPFLVEGGRPVVARFDSPGGFSGADGPPTLVNAEWDAKAGELQSYAKGRGLGDCGSAETYVWDGAMFRLTDATQMGECRGSLNWLTIWRATPVR